MTSTSANITWKQPVDEAGSATVLQITAQPLNDSSSEHIGKVESSTGIVLIHPLKPFTFYKFIVKDKHLNEVLAEIGPIKTWPAGNLHSIVDNVWYNFLTLKHALFK